MKVNPNTKLAKNSIMNPSIGISLTGRLLTPAEKRKFFYIHENKNEKRKAIRRARALLKKMDERGS